MFDFQEIDNWYFAGFPVKKSDNPFDISIINSIYNLRKTIGFPAYKIKFEKKTNTAYTDLNYIYMPVNYMYWSRIEEMASKSEFHYLFEDLSQKQKTMVVLSIYNCFLFHEYTHVIKTQKYNFEYDYEKYLFNIFEDIFVNNQYYDKSSHVFFKVLYSLFYSKELKEKIEYYENLIKDSNITKDQYVEYFGDVLLLHNFNMVFDVDIELNVLYPDNLIDDNKKNLYHNFIRVFNKDILSSSFGTRLQVTHNAWNYIKEFIDDNSKFNSKNANNNYIDENMKGTFSEIGLPKTREENQNLDNILRETTKIVEQHETEDELKEYKNNYYSNKNLVSDVYIHNLDSKQYRNIEMNKDMRKFAQAFKYTFGVNKSPVKAEKQGRDIIEDVLENYYIDGKIFGENKRQKTKEKPEIVLLIDYSFSMVHIIKQVVEATYGLAEGLRGARFNFSIWGHTTDRYIDGSQIYHIYSHGLPDNNGKIRTTQNLKNQLAKSLSINKTANEDYLAIKEMCERGFTKNNNTKILFVLSDGEPSRGDDAVLETIKNIKHYRSMGFNIYSLSLVQGVVTNNNKIYGEKYNFEAYGNKLNEAMRKIASTVVNSR